MDVQYNNGENKGIKRLYRNYYALPKVCQEDTGDIATAQPNVERASLANV